jgi:hypothetical protein
MTTGREKKQVRLQRMEGARYLGHFEGLGGRKDWTGELILGRMVGDH